MAREGTVETQCESAPLLEVSAVSRQLSAKQSWPWRKIALLVGVLVTRTVVALSATVLTPFYPPSNV
jgi:hypothetical protein